MQHSVRRRLLVTLALLLILSTLAGAGPEPPMQPVRRLQSHWDLIQDAVNRGLLTSEQGLVYSAVALFAPDRLPTPLIGTALGKCGTPILVELEAHWQDLSPWARTTLSAWPVAAGARGLMRADSRPVLSGVEQILATAHFAVHYTLAGTDAVANTDADGNSIPDLVDAVAQALERSRAVQVEFLGWLEPPTDATIDPGFPSYDVYIQRLPVQGLTFPEILVGDNEHSPDAIEPFARCSYIILHHQLDIGVMQVTAAHEYNHAIQFGYNAAAEGFDARRWLMEGTATWMEDQVYDEVNDNIGYLPRLFSAPDRSLTHPDNYYASWLFFQYIEEHIGGQATVHNIWERSVPLSGDFSTRVIQQALEISGSELRSAFTTFCAANLLLLPCELAPGPFCYWDSLLYHRYAGMPFTEGGVYLAAGESIYIPPDGVQPLSCDYLLVKSAARTVAAGGYSGSEASDLQGMWIARSGFSVNALPFPMLSNPDPPNAAVSPNLCDALHIIVTNVTDPTGAPTASAGYGLMFSASEPPASPGTITASPTVSATPTLTRTPTTSATPRPGRRLWLPILSRG